MIIIPAVDIMDHKVVQLVGGVPGTEIFSLPDPLQVARGWKVKGTPALHVVDLDGAFGKEDNIDTICSMASDLDLPVQVGGGISTDEKVDRLISAGVARVIIGTRGIRDPDWLSSVAERHPGKVVLALDVKDGRITMKGWQEQAPCSLADMFSRIEDMPLAGILNTNVNVEGKGQGIDVEAATDFISRCPHPVISSGGVSSITDVEALEAAGAVAAVVGVAIYTGAFRPWEWSRPWVFGDDSFL